MSTPSYNLTTDSINIVWKGQVFTVQAESPHFKGLREALTNKDWDAVPNYLTVKKAIASWSEGEFTLQNDSIRFQGEPIPTALCKSLMAMIQRGEDAKPLCRFFERLALNPSKRSVDQLFTFLQHCNIPLTEDGCFLAYKGVKNDLTDCHSGKWGNKPGATNTMPRNRISDDPREACHEGFHVGALSYAQDFGNRVVICKVNPENVVSVPYHSSARKMRVCEYEVVGFHGAALSSTTISSRDVPQPMQRTVTQATPDGAPGKTKKVKAPKLTAKAKAQAVAQGIVPTSTERKRFYRFNKKGMESLLEQQIHHLRRYAGCHLLITGASKIRGGKVALVAAILKARDGDK